MIYRADYDDPRSSLGRSLFFDVARGSIIGATGINKFGRTTNADAADPTDIWDRANPTNDQAIWLAPTASRIHAIVSTDAADAFPAGGGARTIRVFGLKSWDSAESTEVVELNGAGAVNTVNAYVIIHRMIVLTSGATSANVGTITATAASDSTVTAQIQPTEGQTQMAIYGVPSTQTLYVTKFYGAVERDSPTGADVLFRLLWCFDVENQPTIFQIKHTLSASVGVVPFEHRYEPFNAFAGPGILKMQVNSDSNDTFCDGGFGLILDTN